MLLVSPQETAAFFEQMQQPKKMPVIFVGHRPSGATENYVGVHEEEVGRIACEHLIRCGCRRIAYIRGPRTAVGDMRSRGYRKAMSEHGLTVQPDLVVESMDSEESEYRRGHEAMLRLLARRGRPEGVMTYTDLMAVGAMDAARSHGVRIPEEMRFVGCGNDALLCEMEISLTSIDLRGRELGQRAGRLALASDCRRQRPEAQSTRDAEAGKARIIRKMRLLYRKIHPVNNAIRKGKTMEKKTRAIR